MREVSKPSNRSKAFRGMAAVTQDGHALFQNLLTGLRHSGSTGRYSGTAMQNVSKPSNRSKAFREYGVK